ncbi:MAG: hypothetical protein KatS3mg090_0774 [Patescibacteria group bacterium]|nr:MAG: hypothetical protein KatS3mg090_0774 [Patescibacteria group bacterium]
MKPQWLFFGLGNFGKEYKDTRHNIGHQFVDYISALNKLKLKKSEKLKTSYTQFNNKFLAKNISYMNLSGQSLKLFCSYYYIDPDKITVVYDDLDIPLGKFKIQTGVYSKTHNGLKSIAEYFDLNTLNFIRIGIENRKIRIPGQRYVLSKFSSTEKNILKTVFDKVAKLVFSLFLLLIYPVRVLAQPSNIIPTEIITSFNLGFIPYLFITFVFLTLLRFGLRVKKDVEIYGTTILFIICTAIGWFFDNYAISLVIIVIYTLMYIGD